MNLDAIKARLGSLSKSKLDAIPEGAIKTLLTVDLPLLIELATIVDEFTTDYSEADSFATEGYLYDKFETAMTEFWSKGQ
jgi:hypothetical protein